MTTLLKMRAAALLLAVFSTLNAWAQPIGQWEFDDPANRFKATVGGDLSFADGPGGLTEQGIGFGANTNFSVPNLAGQVVQVMRFPAATNKVMGINMPVNTGPNGGSLVNTWTIMMDILFPLTSDNKIRGLMEIDGRIETQDSDIKLNAANAFGAAAFAGSFTANVWHRIAFVVDRSTGQIRKYIDGFEVGTESAGLSDGRFALSPNSFATLFTDDNGESAIGYVSSIQLRNVALSSGQVRALGGATAAGIPQTLPIVPTFIESRAPAANAIDQSPTPTITVNLNSGDSTVPTDSVHLLVDGAEVPADITPTATGHLLSYIYTTAFEPGSEHTIRVNYTENGTARSESWVMTIINYQKVTLPAPILLETFDAFTEGAVPAGWAVTNRTATDVAGLDITKPKSDTYKDWVLLTKERLVTVHGSRRTNMPPISVNGEFITTLTDGSLFYAESDTRGGSQVQVLFSPDFDMTGKTNVFLGFNSSYEQNQDSLGAVEYSIDQGATWLPALYMMDRLDVIRLSNGNVDALATMNTARADQAYALSFGAHIGAPITTALAPFISGRIDDDSRESKRVEILRLAQADRQAKVRLRFTQTGTASWYWAVDNVGFYSINTPVISAQPVSLTLDAGQTAVFNVTATGSGTLAYQWQFKGNNITNATGSSFSITNITPANAGQYRVIVSNADGPTVSAPATLTVIGAPQITAQPLGGTISIGAPFTMSVAARGGLPFTYQWQRDGTNLSGATSSNYVIAVAALTNAGLYRVVVSNQYGFAESVLTSISTYSGNITNDLVVHLTLDGNVDDSSGRGNNGTLAGESETGFGLATFSGAGAQLIGTSALRATNGNYITLGAPDDLKFGSAVNFSFSFWIKGAAGAWTGDPAFIGNKHWTSGSNTGMVVAAQSDGGWKWNWRGGSPTSPRRDSPNLGVLTDGNWHNIVVSHDRQSVVAIFLDGEPKYATSIAGDATIDEATRVVNILQDGTGFYGYSNDLSARFVDILLDDVGIWRRALTPSEASTIHTRGRTAQDLTTASYTGVEKPIITTKPANYAAYAGYRAKFSVVASGTPPLTYQWRFGSDPIQNATAATLTIDGVTAANAGNYTVVVSNAGGSTTSAPPAVLTILQPPTPRVTGQWDFDNGDLTATVGAPLEYRGDTATLTTFPTVTIAGQPARVMRYPGATATQGFVMPHGAAANGGGTKVNNYTLLFDVMYPTESNNKWRTFLQTTVANTDDGDLFVNTSNGIGISSIYQGTILPETWHRVVFVVNSTDGLLTKFIDGVRVGQQNIATTDGRFALFPTALIFSDNDGDTSVGFVNSIQFRDWTLTDAEVTALGMATASGLPGANVGPRMTITKNGAIITVSALTTGNYQLRRKEALSDLTWAAVGTPGPGPFQLAQTGFYILEVVAP